MLVVEDERSIRELVAQQFDARLRLEASPMAAKGCLCCAEPYDVVVLDLMLPEVDG